MRERGRAPGVLMGVALLATALLPATSLALPEARPDDEATLAAAVASAFASLGRPEPRRDRALDRAARALAWRALDEGTSAATDPQAVARASSLAGSWDPAPRALAARARPARRAATTLASRKDLAALPATHFGIGLERRGDTAAAVLLMTERKAELEPFPRVFDVGMRARLAGRLLPPLKGARGFVTTPSGSVRTLEMDAAEGAMFATRVTFAQAGYYTFEIVAESPSGPEVVALFEVRAGPEERLSGTRQKGKDLWTEAPEQRDLGLATAQVHAAINARRTARGLEPLARSAALDAVASEHAAEMARLGYFAHTSPHTGDVGQRLKRAGVGYRRVAENLGEAGSALEAHRAIERSPGHLANVLDPEVELLGIGVARVRRGGIQNVVLVEVFVKPP